MKKVIKGTNLETMGTDTLMLDPVIVPESYDVPTTAAVAAGITEAVGGASDALQEQIDDIAEKAGSGYTPKGPASVATLNGLSGQENGWLYTMTDAGTLTDGSVTVVAGDTVAWDATNSVWYKTADGIRYYPCQTALFELGVLTIQGKNDIYMGDNLFIFKRSKTFFRLKEGDTVPFDCVLFGYDENFSFIGQENYTSGSPVNKNYSWLKAVVEKSIVENDEEIAWEQGYLQAGEPKASTYYVRTDFLDFSVFKNYYIKSLSNNPLLAVYCYDSNKIFITGRSYGYRQVTFLDLLSIGDFVKNQDDVAYIKLVFHYTPDRTTTPAQAYNLVHVGALQTNANFDSVNSIEVLENVKNDANGYAVVRFSYPLYYSKGRSLLEPTMDSSQYNSTVYRNSGLLRLPYNYTQKGQPCPLLIFCHPSDKMQILNSANDFFSEYATFWDYLQKEGFAIMDCYHTSNKYNYFAHDWGQPLAGACYDQAYKWVCENYNIDQERVFVSAKSQGGIRALLMALGFSSIPVKACGPLAPALGFCPQFGYNKNDFTIVSDDCEFEGTMPDISNYTESDFDYANTMPEELKDYVDANKEKIVGVNSFMINCMSCAAVDLFDKLKTHAYTNADFLSTRRFCNAPIKMWHAADDGGINAHKAFIFQLQNCGCNAEIRVMPSGTGGHGAVSYAANSIRVPSLTTRLGYVCTDIPLAMVEMVNYFIKFGG